MTLHVLAYDTAHPGDTAGLAAALARWPAARIAKLALLAKTEGNSDVNDYSREFGLLAARLAIAAHGGDDLLARTTLLFSTGCEGAMTPFGYLFAEIEDDAAPSALVMGRGASRPLAEDEVGTLAHADLASAAVRGAMTDAGVDAAEVGLAIVKTPVMAPGATGGPRRRITSGFSKAVAALGAGTALGEVDRGRLSEAAFDRDHDLHARRAVVFSGAEVDRVEVLLLANRRGVESGLAIHTGFLADVIDAAGVRRLLDAAGVPLVDGVVAAPDRVAATILKVGLAPDGFLRGRRTTMRTSHLDMDKHLRATASGVVGSILGTTAMFVSANTVHQAPPGGGICSFIVRAN